MIHVTFTIKNEGDEITYCLERPIHEDDDLLRIIRERNGAVYASGFKALTDEMVRQDAYQKSMDSLARKFEGSDSDTGDDTK